MLKKAYLLVAGLLLPVLLSAKITLPALFQDHLVLQQNGRVSIWGWQSSGSEITIKPSWGKGILIKPKADGSWQAAINTLKAGSGYALTISDKEETITLSDIAFGEVWLCSGQSNMNFPLGKFDRWRSGVINYEKEIAAADHPEIRFFTVEKQVARTPQKDCKGSWQICIPQTAASFSAVAYYFAKEIQKELGVPVGIIHSSWGGTPVEAWTKEEILASDKNFQPILERFKKHTADTAKAKADYKAATQDWKQKKAENKLTGIDFVQGPREPLTADGNKSPANLYNAMIAPLVPYTIKGALWYQGESNMERAYQYRTLFPAMIKGWRKDWNADFPFYFVQIAPHRSQHAEIREAQFISYKTTPNTGIAVITDAGDSSDIHPRNKEVVGKRLSLWALGNTYGKKLEYAGPEYRSMKALEDKIELSFSHATGLKAINGDLNEFTIAGEDHVFHPAKAEIKGNKIVVWSKDVSKPLAVRFGWKYVPHAELYNAAGLPASPFRTDNWAGETDSNR